MKLKLVAGLVIVLSLLLASCVSLTSGTTTSTITTSTSTTEPKNPEDVVQSAQQIIDAIAGVQPGAIPEYFTPDEPADVPRREGDWDVNEYFTVLTHLSVEPGYVIDYLYKFDGMGGRPFIYARPADKAPYASVDEYVANTPAGGSSEERDLSSEFFDHIKVDDTREGYFEFVALRIMDTQFFQWWHAGYNDTTIVSNADSLEQTMSAAGSAFEANGLPAGVQKQARKLDLTPTVEFPDDSTAVVRIVTFTKWGGFGESVYTISRQFPHAVRDVKSETLVEYDCGVSF